MSKVYKTAIFISSFFLILLIGQVLFAQGKGYFLEKNNSLYILDNLRINGYLAVEKDLSATSGFMGDVLVSNYFLLDENNKFYFCQDNKLPIVNTPLNMDCASKSLAWNTDSLEVKNNSYKLTTTTLAAPQTKTINLKTTGTVQTGFPVRLTGCFSNDGSGDCSTELKTGTLVINDSLSALSGNKLIFSAQKLKFNEINLGPEANMNNQYLCWAAGSNDSCLTARSGDRVAGGVGSEKWDFYNPENEYTNQGVINYTDEGAKLCCHLNINF